MRGLCSSGCLVLATLAGCSAGQGTIVVTITAEPAISGVARFVGGAVAGTSQRAVSIVPPGAPVSLPPEGRYGIDAPAGSEVVLRLSALSADGAVLGTGETRTATVAGVRTMATLVIRPQVVPPDGGEPGDQGRPLDLGGDSSRADLAEVADLRRVDLSAQGPADAAPADLAAANDLAVVVADLTRPNDPRSADLAAADGGVTPDMAALPCARDGDCPGGLCNWALNICAAPMANGGTCSRDVECVGRLCNWAKNVCAMPGAPGAACSRDVECAAGLCNWKLDVCAAKQVLGGPCRRDVECVSARCNAALDLCI